MRGRNYLVRCINISPQKKKFSMADASFYTALHLYSIGYGCRHRGVATLHDLIAVEDGVNRSASSLEELNTQLGMLLWAGLIAYQDKSFTLTSDGRDLLESTYTTSGSVFDELELLRNMLNKRYANFADEFPAIIDEAEYETCYQAYYHKT